MSFFNWWNFGLCSGLLIGVTLIVYVQDSQCCNGPIYRFTKAVGSPLTPLLQVSSQSSNRGRQSWEFIKSMEASNLDESGGDEASDQHGSHLVNHYAVWYVRGSSHDVLHQARCDIGPEDHQWLCDPAADDLRARSHRNDRFCHNRILVPVLRRATGNERRLTIL
nr:protein NRT1/ PTR FAMILY 5.6-like [Ipomoea batatas]